MSIFNHLHLHITEHNEFYFESSAGDSCSEFCNKAHLKNQILSAVNKNSLYSPLTSSVLSSRIKQEGSFFILEKPHGSLEENLPALDENLALITRLFVSANIIKNSSPEESINENIQDRLLSPCGIYEIEEDRQEEYLNALLDFNENPNIVDLRGRNPLHYAAYLGNERSIKILLERGINSNVVCNEGHEPTHLALNNPVILQQLLENGANPDGRKYSLLINAVLKNSLDSVELLLRYGANANVKGGCEKKSPLHFAVKNGCLEIVLALLNPRDSSSSSSTDSYVADSTSLWDSQNANPNSCDTTNSTPLFDCQDLQIMKLLIACGANPRHINNDGETPLHVAARNDWYEGVDFLIKQEADLNKKNNKGETPLQIAKGLGFSNIIQLLLNKEVSTEF